MDVAHVARVIALRDDRDVRQARPVEAVNEAAFVGQAQRFGVRHMARGLCIAVAVESPHLRIEIEEVGDRDLAAVQRAQAVLHAGVVDRPPRIALRVRAEQVGVGLEYVAADAAALGGDVVDVRHVRRLGDAAAAHAVNAHCRGVGPDEGAGERDVPVVAGARVESLDRNLLCGGPANGVGLEDGVRQPALELLDEGLLEHHQRLALQVRVRVLVVPQLGGIQVGEAARELPVAQGRGDVLRALVVLGGAAAAEGDHELLVPSRPREGADAGVVEHRQPVHAAVDRARLDAHDVGHGVAVAGGGLDQVARPLAGGVGERLEAVASGRVEVLHLVPRRAVGVARGGQVVLAQAALVGGDMRSGDDRSGDRVVGDGELCHGPLSARRQQVVAVV